MTLMRHEKCFIIGFPCSTCMEKRWHAIFALLSHLPCQTGGENGSADTVRDPRGFAVKFYTEDGNWDLVGNNTPIFFIRDPIFVGH